MSYYIQKGNLPTWHNSYVANSTVYVEAFAEDSNNENTNAKYLKNGKQIYLNDIGNHFTDYVISDLFGNGPVLKGCGLNFEEGTYITKLYEGGKPSQNNLSEPNDTPPVGSTKTVSLSRQSNGTLTINNNGTNETYYNVPPLIYFEICGGGGGGAGKTRSGSGGGSGAGSIAGILNFTQSANFIVTIGGGGGGSFATFYQDYGGADGADGGDTILQDGTSFNSKKQHLIAKGGQGGPRPVNSTDNRFAAGSIAGVRATTTATTAESKTANLQACNHSVLILRTIPGGRGGISGSLVDTNYTETDRKGADITASAIATLDLKSGTHIVDPVSNKVGGACGADWDFTAGGGGASAFGSGGRGQGQYNGTNLERGDGALYGSGGGGAGGIDPVSSDNYCGGNGAPGKLYLAWIPYTEVTA